MSGASTIEPTPWDAAALGVPCYELRDPGEATLARAAREPGHYTVRIDPLAPKRLLHEHGFYYCDTLLEPHCTPERFVARPSPAAGIAREPALERVLAICHGAFAHDRFHRDFNVARAGADARYDRWLAELHAAGHVRGLLHRGELAGFAAVVGGKLVLHALAAPFRGRGLAPGLWTALCRELFDAGEPEVSSSVSAANLPVLNLYAGLGFRFRNPLDLYHRMTA